MRWVDAHHHLWDPARRAYPWMDGRLAPFRRRFGPEDLDAAGGPHGIGQTVVVQTVASVEETKEFLAVAGTGGRVAGVVGWVDLTVADVADAGLAYDLLVRERELPAAWAVAERLPQLGFVLDHLGKPRIREALVEPWAGELHALARLPNVTCKVSGLVTEAAWDSWTPRQLAPYVATAAAAFGPERLLFGSDWPVCLLASDYAEVVAAAEETLEWAGLDTAERDAVFGANARRVYRLPEPTDNHGG